MTEWNASGYNRESTLQQTMAQEQLAMLTLTGTERILDVGCGDGKITAAIAERVPSGSVMGVDPSSDMVAFAADHFSTHTNLRFAVADARRLPYRNEFDLAVSFNALHWVPEQGEALASIHAVLKPNGRAMLRLVPDGKRESLEDVIEEIRKQPRWSSHFASFNKPYLHLSAEEYRALAEKTGFKVLRLDVLDKAWDFKTREGFVAFGRVTFVEWIKHIPEESWNDFITEVLDRYRTVASETEADANTFKFFQMEVELAK
jgi:trans-aconitate 2-methyltransferase